MRTSYLEAPLPVNTPALAYSATIPDAAAPLRMRLVAATTAPPIAISRSPNLSARHAATGPTQYVTPIWAAGRVNGRLRQQGKKWCKVLSRGLVIYDVIGSVPVDLKIAQQRGEKGGSANLQNKAS